MRKIFISLFTVLLQLCLVFGFVGCQGNEATSSSDEVLRISAVSKEIEVDETFTLTATSHLSGKVSYETSDASVASVTQSGVVTGVSVGTAQITLSVGKKSATCAVTVTEKAEVHSPLSFLVDEIRVRVGGTPRKVSVLYENILVSSDVIFEIENPEIATVSETGVISAVKGGETTLTATYGEFIAQLKVSVEEFIVVQLHGEMTYLKAQETTTLTAKVMTGVEQTEVSVSEIEWSIDAPEVAEMTVENGVATVKGLASGVATLTASYKGVKAQTIVSVAYGVTTFEQLKELAPLHNRYIILENDIDLSGVKKDDWAGGNNITGFVYAVIPELNAMLDGNGKRLHGLTLTERLVTYNSGNLGTPSNVGFFGVIGARGSVKNLVFDGSLGAVTTETVDGETVAKIQPYVDSHVGLLAWKNQGTIENTYVRGQIINKTTFNNGMWTVGMVFINTGKIESVMTDIHFQHIKSTKESDTPAEDVRRFAFVVSNQGIVKNCVALNEQYKNATNADRTWTTSSISTIEKKDKNYVAGTYTWGAELGASKDTSDYALPSDYQKLTQHADKNRIDCFVFMTYAELIKADGSGYDATCNSWTNNAYATATAQTAREKLGKAWSFDAKNGVIKLGTTVVYQAE